MKNLTILIITGLFVALLASSCTPEDILPKTNFEPNVSHVLSKYEIVELDYDALLAEVEGHQGKTFTLNLNIPSKPDWQLSLTKDDISDIFPAEHKTYLIGANNELTEVEGPDFIAVEGNLTHSTKPANFTFGSGIFEGLMVDQDGEEYYIEPLSNLDKRAPKNQYAFFNTRDLIYDEDANCDLEAKDPQTTTTLPSGTEARAQCNAVETTMLCDFHFYAYKFGRNYNNTVNFMGSRLYYASRRYWADNRQPINLVSKALYVTTQNYNWPNATSNSKTFVEQWNNYYNYSWFNRGDVNYLFTGRNVSGAWGRADGIGKVCRYPSNAFSFGEKMPSDYQSALLMAHEIGHTLNARHDNSKRNFMHSGYQNWNSSLGNTAKSNLYWQMTYYGYCTYLKGCQ